jgi:4-hydroxy-3-polyprenylbenzoate decarboxylase
MPYKDLREFLDILRDRRELKQIQGANAELEIGGITQLAADTAKCPALLFDTIPGYESRYRVLTNILANKTRERLIFGINPDIADKDAARSWRERLKYFAPIAPVEVSEASVKRHTILGDDIDLTKLPWIRWHESDRCPCFHGAVMIAADPASGAIRLSSYPLVPVDRRTMVVQVPPDFIDPIWPQYWSKKKPYPVALSLGQDPVLLAIAATGTPPGHSGYGFAGWVRGAPIEITNGDYTSLPIPAAAEIVLEGDLEWPAATEVTAEDPPRPILKVHRIHHRDEPIIIGDPPFTGSRYGVLASRAAFLWNDLENLSAVRITAINHRVCGAAVIAIKQSTAADVQRVSRALLKSSATGNLKFAIIVDDDIDPYNLEKVFWAVATRYEPELAVNIVRRLRSDSITGDSAEPNDVDAVAIIDGCRPFHWLDKFPRTTDISEELAQKTMEKWGKVLAQRA